MTEDRHQEALISTTWLANHLDDPNLRLFECTTHLRPVDPKAGIPYRPEAGHADYAEGHIPGAGFLDLPGELSDPDGNTAFTMPSAERFAEVMSRNGVGETSRVVVYSRGRVMWATRAWWMFRVMGFDQVAVLDGGFEAWLAEGRPVRNDVPAHAPARFVARPRPELLVDSAAVLEATRDPSVLLINTLGEADFRGLAPSRYGRPGRIPSSVNLPFATLTGSDGRMTPLDQAAARVEGLGASAAERIICYCGGGISATEALFALHRLGYERLALYDGSMSEWARDSSLPIERDPAKAD